MPEQDEKWDGIFVEEDCEEELFTPDLPDEVRPAWIDVGVRLTHIPTGKNVTVYSAPSYPENRKRAVRALRHRVNDR